MSKKQIKPNRLYIVKELVLGTLAVLSIGLVVFELFGYPSEQQHVYLARFDFGIACLFLLDFAISFGLATDRQKYFRQNWYFLLAAIPLTDAVTSSLRGLRVLSLLRLFRAGEHLGFGIREVGRRG